MRHIIRRQGAYNGPPVGTSPVMSHAKAIMNHSPATSGEAGPLPRLDAFVRELGNLLQTGAPEGEVLRHGRVLLARLVQQDDWLPASHARPHPDHYRQYRLHVDPEGRFSVVSFVWGPGQCTPVHDHTVWGLIGMLRGAEYSQPFRLDAAGRPVPDGQEIRLDPGQVEAVSPGIGDIHRVRNAYDDRVSVSIHVYGADIGRVNRSVFTPQGERKPFVSGYSDPVPADPADAHAR
jgi:predicted metal-dependent enzyme (double-stranded beta helix superfamily)